MPKTKVNKTLFVISLLLIILAGAFFRVWQLEDLPPGLQYDEAYNGLDGLKASQTGDLKVFYDENNGREGLYINVVGLFLKIFGVNNMAVRLSSALFGILTLIGFFLLAKELKFSRFTIAMGTFMMSFSFWHINFSRLVYRGIMAPMLLVWIFYFFFKGFHSIRINERKNIKGHLLARGLVYFAIAGLLTGIGFHTYISFRVVPLIFAILIFFFILEDRNFLKIYWKGALLFVIGAFVTAMPLFLYFYQNPADFSGRSNAVSVFNAPNQTFVSAFSESLLKHLASFFLAGDPNQRHNHSAQALIPMVWSILFGLGFILTIKEIFFTIVGRFKKTRALRLFCAAVLAQAIFWVMLIPGILSIEGIPHALRIIGTIPAVFLIILFSFEYLLKLYNKVKYSPRRKLKPWRWNILRLSLAGLIITVVLSGMSQVYLYFVVWANDPRTSQALERDLFDLGKIANQVELKQRNYMILASEVAINEEKTQSSLKTTEFVGYPNIHEFSFYHPFEGLAMIPCENSLIILHKSDGWLQKQFQQKCSNLTLEEIVPKNGIHSFWVLH
ncbi:MAG: phospholipid carrier-dependent glycosyltransferase [Patescibacteria group bacterium]|nr:phospholipid carrier-dependent glycosyltransferase [Patescibacteria group bacterium]